MRVLAFVCVLLCSSSVLAAHLPQPPVNPRTYTSPSGRYALFVDPSHRNGQRNGSYRLTLDGKQVWEAMHSFTLYDAAVTDDGVVAGYAYTNGIEGFAPLNDANRNPDDQGEYIVAIFEPGGKLRLEHRTRREHSRFLHVLPSPLAMGMFIDAEHDRFVIRIADADVNIKRERWDVYRLSDGTAEPPLHPTDHAGEGVRFSIDAKPLAGTELTLVQWWHYPGAGKAGARFSLIDTEGKPIWSHTLPGDYDREKHPDPERNGILDTSQPGRFTIRFVQENQRVTFAAHKDPDEKTGWRVFEVQREAYEEPPPATQPAAEKIELKLLGEIQLGKASATQPVRHVRELRIDQRGRVGFLRWDSGEDDVVVLMQPDETRIREIRIEGLKDKTRLTPIDGDRWLATSSGHGEQPTVRAWWINADSGEVEEIPRFVSPPIESLAGVSDGGFAALTMLHRRYTIENALIGFDAHGNQRWRIDEEHGNPQKLFSPSAICLTGDREIAVVSSVADDVKLFSEDGRHLRTLDLKEIFGKEPNYPSDIWADSDGGVIVHDFHGDSPIWRITRAGELRGKLTPQFEDSKPIEFRGVQVAPNDSIWISDDDSILRLNADGIVDRVIGRAPDVEDLTEISAITTDERGRIYAAATRTGAVHVFDPSGQRLFICKPAPADFQSDARPEHLTLDGEGNIYVGPTTLNEKSHYIKFDPTGQRIDAVPADGEKWLFIPGTTQRWVRQYREVCLADAQGKTLRTLARQANRNWLDIVDEIAVAPDGALAVASGGFLSAPRPITFFTREGDPVRTLDVPGNPSVYSIIYDGKRALLNVEEGILIVPQDGQSPKLFAKQKDRWHELVPRPRHDELWLWVKPTNRIERYQLP